MATKLVFRQMYYTKFVY